VLKGPRAEPPPAVDQVREALLWGGVDACEPASEHMHLTGKSTRVPSQSKINASYDSPLGNAWWAESEVIWTRYRRAELAP
jgi:hypothetical protein